MSYGVSKIRDVGTIKALRGDNLTIDLGKAVSGTLTSWMRKHPNDPLYRVFTIRENRFLELTNEETRDLYNEEGALIQAIEGKWYFDVEVVDENQNSKTMYAGRIFFKNGITNSGGNQ